MVMILSAKGLAVAIFSPLDCIPQVIDFLSRGKLQSLFIQTVPAPAPRQVNWAHGKKRV